MRARLAERVAGLEGWTYLEELWALHEAARCFPGRDSLNVVEIGSWKGRSTVALALGVRGRGPGRVYAIDPHTGSREHVEAWGTVDTFGDFVKNINRAGVADVVEPIRSTSHDACLKFNPNSVDILFVDGSHDYQDVRSDIADWEPLLADGAVVAFNDPTHPGVYRALREAVLNSRSPYRSGHYVANTLFFRFQRHPARIRNLASLVWLRMLLAVRFRAQGLAIYTPTYAVALGRRFYEKLLP